MSNRGVYKTIKRTENEIKDNPKLEKVVHKITQN